jgi:hypothetical protein
MSLCDGFTARVKSYTGVWHATSVGGRPQALAALKKKMLRYGSVQEGITCEGRECRKDPRALCYGTVQINGGAVRYLPTTVAVARPGRKPTRVPGVLCLYEGDVRITCHCTQPPPKGKGKPRG